MKRSQWKHRAAFFYITFVILIALSLWFILPFIKAIVGALILAFVANPLYQWLVKKFKHPTSMALLTTILVLSVILVPFAFAIQQVVTESTITYINLKRTLVEPKECSEDGMCKVIFTFREILSNPRVKYYLEDSLNAGINYVTQQASEFVVTLPKLILNIFITLIALFYFLRDGDYFSETIRRMTPIKKENLNLLFHRFVNISKGIVYGYILTAIIQGITALIGFYAIILFFSSSGVPIINTPILWALILALFSMIPVLGSGFVWVPMSIIYLVQGYFTSNSDLFFAGLVLFLYGLIVISNIDNVLRPLLSGKAAKVHPLLIFVGIFGGLVVFGFLGIVVGPLILAMFVTYAKMYEEGRI